MATLAELRALRYENVEGDMAGTTQRAAREGSSGRTAIPDEYQKHYREDYGTTLTDSEYSAINEDQSKFKESVATVKTQLSDKQAEIQGLYDKQVSEWDAQTSTPMPSYSTFKDTAVNELELYPEKVPEGVHGTNETIFRAYKEQEELEKEKIQALADYQFVDSITKNEDYMKFYDNWASTNTVKVYLSDLENPSLNKTYLVTPDTAAAINAINFNGDGDTVKREDGSILIYTEAYAAPMRRELNKYEAQLHSSLSTAYIESIASGRESLNKEYALANESIASQNKIVAAKEEENANTLSTIRTTYSNKLKAMGETIGSMNYAKSN